jgi:O-acetyl-ADP-ribose deacetylase (regulator of RNase III)
MRHTDVHIVQGDITQRQVDAIVNAANSTLLGGGGVDGAIHRVAGPGLLEECRKLGGCRTGEAKATGGYGIQQVKHIIHTVGPIYGRDAGREAELLASCYRESLRLAAELACRSIAFPSISTGAYGYPIEEASRVALRSIRDYLDTNEHPLELVEMVAFSDRDRRIYEQAHSEFIAN